MTAYRVKNWERFQHYKNRNPPWVRLYVEIIEMYDVTGAPKKFYLLPDAAKLTFVALVCLASKRDGIIPTLDAGWLQAELGIKTVDTQALIDAGYLTPINIASDSASMVASNPARKTLAGLSRHCAPETETETETETEGEAESSGSAAAAHWTIADYVADLKTQAPEYARLNDAQIANALAIEPDPEHRARAYNDALLVCVGGTETHKNPLQVIRGYMRNARKFAGGGGHVNVFDQLKRREE
jgi:hypothetical protein